MCILGFFRIYMGFIKMKSVFVRTCALRRKPKSPFLTKRLLVSSRLHFNSFLFILRNNIYFQDLEFKVQAALGFVSQSANGLIFLAVSEQISQVNVVYHCDKGDQMAPPFGNLQAFQEKGLT